MKTELSLEEIKRLIDYVKWNKQSYTEKASKYFYDKEIPNYRKEIYKPTMDEMDNILNKLIQIRDELK